MPLFKKKKYPGSYIAASSEKEGLAPNGEFLK
jgi:hypothetical protein